MGTFHEEFWLSEGAGQTRSERKGGAYSYYLPTPLKNMKVLLEPEVVGDLGRAEQAISRLNEESDALHGSEGIARLLLRTEAVSSSYIEGLAVGAKRLLKAELNLHSDGSFEYDSTAAKVVGNIYAMRHAVDAAQNQDKVTVDTILAIHKTLCKGTRLEEFGGIIRDKQNWVGGNSYNPLNADYVPPAPQHVEGLLEDLAAYCNDSVISPVVQAAMAHAQFESIHPFVDGNGRTGRALIHLILRKRGLAPKLVPPVSLVMAAHSKSYILGLTECRYADSDNDEDIQAGFNEWISFFAGACLRACDAAVTFEEDASRLQAEWRERLGHVRKNSSLDLLLKEMFGIPIFTIATASAVTGRAISAVAPAVERCIRAGIVKPMGNQKRNRSFEVPDVIKGFSIFEHGLAREASIRRYVSPTGSYKEIP